MSPHPEEATPRIRDSAQRVREAIFAECLQRFTSEGDPGLRRSCDEHPEHAEFLRSQIALLRRFGFGGNDGTWGAESFGPFRLIRRLGGGGMGMVFLAEESALARQVALKILRPEVLESEAMRLRFAREVRTAASLQHRAIVTIHAVGETEGIPWFSMEPIDGASLAEILRSVGRHHVPAWSERDLAHALGLERSAGRKVFGAGWNECMVRVALQIAEALSHAHGRGVLHRDVKSSNVMVARDGRAVLVDFGLALAESAQSLTRTGAPIGSVPYLPPEIVGGSVTSNPGSDVYALGVVLYEILTGRLPFSGQDLLATQQAILRGNPVAPRTWNPRIQDDLENVVLKAIAPEPSRRYRTAADLATDLRHLLAGEPVSAHRPGPWLLLRRWVRRHQTLATASVLLFLLLVVAPMLWAVSVSATNVEIRRLSDLRIATELVEHDARLWPRVPRVVDGPRGMDWWIRAAEDVLARMAQYATELSELRAQGARRAAVPDPASSQYERALHAELARVREQRTGVRFLDRDGYRAWAAELEAEEARLANLLDERFGWRFATPEESLLHDRLVDLRTGLSKVSELLPRMIERRRAALEIAKRSLVDHAEAWKATLAAIADTRRHPRYRGLRFEAQLGLVPLGPDPDSGLEEFAHLGSGEPARRGADGRLVLSPATGIVLVLLPGGQATIGAIPPDAHHEVGDPFVDPMAGPSDGPLHHVWIDPHFLSKYEVTQGQWFRETGTAGSEYRFGSSYVPGQPVVTELHPVDSVTRDSADRVLARWGLLLPTCVQHEYASRAGTNTPWWTGSEPETLQGCENLWDDRSDLLSHEFSRKAAEAGLSDPYVLHAPVGSFRANPFGFHDMLGNAREWCRDSIANAVLAPRHGDGATWNSDSAGLRGGDYVALPSEARASIRCHTTPGLGTAGFRPVLAIEGRIEFAPFALTSSRASTTPR